MKTSLKQRDYRKYEWKTGEWIAAVTLCIGITIFLAIFFYRSVIAAIPLSVVGVLCFRLIRQKKAEKTKRDLTIQFRECILTVSASLRAGYAVENAFRDCRQDMTLLYGEEALICQELDYIRRGLDINITLEELLMELAQRSDCTEIREFAQIFRRRNRSKDRSSAGDRHPA